MDLFPILSHPMCVFLFSVLSVYKVGSFLYFFSSLGSLCSFLLGVKHQSMCVLLFVTLLSTLDNFNICGYSHLGVHYEPPLPHSIRNGVYFVDFIFDDSCFSALYTASHNMYADKDVVLGH